MQVMKLPFLLVVLVVLTFTSAENQAADRRNNDRPAPKRKNAEDIPEEIEIRSQEKKVDNRVNQVEDVRKPQVEDVRKPQVENVRKPQVEDSQQQQPVQQQQRQEQRGPPGASDTPHEPLLADEPECAKEIAIYCKDTLKTSDVIVMQCLLNVKSDGSHLSDKCSHLLWTYKKQMTEDKRFHQAAEQFCQPELQQYSADCAAVPKEKSANHLLFCLIDHKENMSTDGQCRNFLTRVETIVFSDFHLIGPFVTACESDIEKFKCGKVAEEADGQHTQGTTIACLLTKLVQLGQGADVLKSTCRHELLRLAELQADDFNLDRPLFFACREDRDRFCGEIQAGEGRVLACLTRLANHPHMNALCREKLLLRQQVVAQDYRVSHVLMRSCQRDINQWQCQPTGADDYPHFYLSYVLLCLENAMHSGKQVSGECQARMFDHRQAIMTDYRLSPEVVLHCTASINQYCKGMDQEGDKILNCLMKSVRTHEDDIDSNCKAAVFNLVKVADIGSDYRVDPLLQKACGAAIQTLCSDQQNSETEVMSCLMNNADAKVITEECEDRLLEVQFFLSRDFSLDPNLYRACKVDAERICQAPANWGDIGRNDTKPETTGLILPCLFRYSYVQTDDEKTQLDPKCVAEVRRVIRERAVSVHLLPGIGEKCVHDLSDHCEKHGPGEELECLKTKLDKIQNAECKAAVLEFVDAESKDFQLNRILTKACRPVIDRYCQSLVSQDIDNGEVLECLRSHKMESEMTNKCRSYVNHYELVNMADYKFSYKFKKACKADVEIFCEEVKDKNKADIIKCLSETLFEHTVLGAKETETQTLSKECKKQLRVEYLEVRQNEEIIKPKLKLKCENEIQAQCKDVEGQANVMECLRDKKDELGPECRQYVFRHEEIQFNDNTFDGMLQKACGPVINTLCPKVDRAKVLGCLKRSKYLPGMTPECLAVVQTRQREQVADIMLQPSLRDRCADDIKMYCGKAVEEMKKIRNMDAAQRQRMEKDGKRNPVLICLRKQFAITNKPSLKTECRLEVQQIIMESEVDPRLDPPFYAACKNELTKGECGEKVAKGGFSHTDVVECVKSRYYQNRVTDKNCKEEMDRRTSEEMSDVHIDTVLYEVCAADIKHYCSDLQQGMGRRIQCILKATESSNVQLAEACRIKLEERKQLWRQALKNSPPESLRQFAVVLSESPVRNTAMTVVAVALIGIFLFGLCFGRCSKRIRRELKNK